MIQLKAKLSDGSGIRTVKLSAPESWDEVTVRQFLGLEYDWDKIDLVRALAILTGADFMSLAGSADKKLNGYLDRVLGRTFAKVPDWEALPVPDKICLGGKSLYIKPIGRQAFGQFVQVKKELATIKDRSEVSRLIPKIVAIHLAPQLYPDDWPDKIPQAEELVLDSPILEIYPVAGFFLKKYFYSLTPGVLALIIRTIRRKSRGIWPEIERILKGSPASRISGS